MTDILMTPLEIHNVLSHYGVKGMRWGRISRRKIRVSNLRRARKVEDIRKHRGRDSDPRIATRKDHANSRRIRTDFSASSARVNGPVLRTVLKGMDATNEILRKVGSITLVKGFNQSTLKVGKSRLESILEHDKSRPVDDVMFPPNKEFKRQSSLAESEVRAGTYMAYTPEDVARYRSEWWAKAKQETTIRAKGVVRTPSLKSRFEAMADIIDNKSVDGSKTVRQLLIDGEESKAAKAWVKIAPRKDLGKYAYGKLAGKKWNEDPVGKRFLDRLREQGFDAMLDDEDAAIQGYSKDPLVIVNPDKFEVKETRKRSVEDRDKEREEYTRYLKEGRYKSS